MKSLLLAFALGLVLFPVAAQNLRPGFDPLEYAELLKVNYRTHIEPGQWAEKNDLPMPDHYTMLYRAPAVAFNNLWDLWSNTQKKEVVISVRGTVAGEASFMANLYAAMVPAKGKLKLSDSVDFAYDLSPDSAAFIHVGWLVSLGYMSGDIKQHIDSCYQAGIRDIILTGHSQGGAITFLLTAWLRREQEAGRFPADIQFKTYCGAGPKTGNLRWAYSYEYMTRGGWAFNAVNSADWVPDVPFSIQTVEDFTRVNPFGNARSSIRKMKIPKRWVLNYAYGRLSKPAKKAARNYEKYLGKYVSKGVQKQLPGFEAPSYAHSNYYVRAGETIVLMADAAYYQQFGEDKESNGVWYHHWPAKYLWLLEHQFPK